MAEGQGKEEEKFDFTGEGEAVGYISLEQARVLAMQTAKETPGEYGSQYQDISMAFEVVQANEGEDYYDVSAYHSRGIAYRKLGQDAKADADEAQACSLDSGFCFIVGRR